MSCTGGPTASFDDVTITPSLTPQVTAIWHHPFFGGGGCCLGSGGLQTSKYALEGDLQVDLSGLDLGIRQLHAECPDDLGEVPRGRSWGHPPRPHRPH